MSSPNPPTTTVGEVPFGDRDGARCDRFHPGLARVSASGGSCLGTGDQIAVNANDRDEHVCRRSNA